MVNPFFENGEQSSNNSNGIELTAEMFFGANGHAGYFTKEEFLKYGKSLRDPEAVDLKTAINCMNGALNVIGTTKTRTDRGNRIYIHPEFLKAKGRVGVKLILEYGMEGFISDYQNGNIKVVFTLDDLIVEAKRNN